MSIVFAHDGIKGVYFVLLLFIFEVIAYKPLTGVGSFSSRQEGGRKLDLMIMVYNHNMYRINRIKSKWYKGSRLDGHMYTRSSGFTQRLHGRNIAVGIGSSHDSLSEESPLETEGKFSLDPFSKLRSIFLTELETHKNAPSLSARGYESVDRKILQGLIQCITHVQPQLTKSQEQQLLHLAMDAAEAGSKISWECAVFIMASRGKMKPSITLLKVVTLGVS